MSKLSYSAEPPCAHPLSKAIVNSQPSVAHIDDKTDQLK